jgi:ethanolamine ammonia-lyase small subunit
MREAWRRQLSGVHLKNEAQPSTLDSDMPADGSRGNFLLAVPSDQALDCAF